MSEENKTIELKDEKLEKVAGGDGMTSSWNGYSVNDCHQVNYADGSGYKKARIESINTDLQKQFYIYQELVYFNQGGGFTGYCYWSLSEVQDFWNKETM